MMQGTWNSRLTMPMWLRDVPPVHTTPGELVEDRRQERGAGIAHQGDDAVGPGVHQLEDVRSGPPSPSIDPAPEHGRRPSPPCRCRAWRGTVPAAGRLALPDDAPSSSRAGWLDAMSGAADGAAVPVVEPSIVVQQVVTDPDGPR